MATGGSPRVAGRRAAFWVAVGVTSIAAQFALELAADKLPGAVGLRRLVAYIHRGPTGGN